MADYQKLRFTSLKEWKLTAKMIGLHVVKESAQRYYAATKEPKACYLPHRSSIMGSFIITKSPIYATQFIQKGYIHVEQSNT